MDTDQYSNAVEADDRFYVFIKKDETGRRQETFEEVSSVIRRELFAIKKERYRQSLLDSLKTVY